MILKNDRDFNNINWFFDEVVENPRYTITMLELTNRDCSYLPNWFVLHFKTDYVTALCHADLDTGEIKANVYVQDDPEQPDHDFDKAVKWIHSKEKEYQSFKEICDEVIKLDKDCRYHEQSK